MKLDIEPARLRELADRLVAPGPKAEHVSASETHEIADGLIALLDYAERLEAVVEAARRRLGYCECDWEVTGHTGACMDLAVALAALDEPRGSGGGEGGT